MIQYGYIFVLMDEDNFRHQKLCIALVATC